METVTTRPQSSTFQELVSFLQVLNSNKTSGAPLLKRADSSKRVVINLERRFSQIEQVPVFRRLGRHTQLVLNFAQAS